VRADLTRRQSLGRERDDELVDAGEAPLPLGHDPGLERPVTVTRHLDLDLADLGQHRFRPGAVP